MQLRTSDVISNKCLDGYSVGTESAFVFSIEKVMVRYKYIV